MSTTPHTSRSHALLSPSSADRWTTCTASVPFMLDHQDQLPASSGGVAADEGTLAHEVCEALLLGKDLPKGANAEMIRHGAAYADYVHEILPNGFVVEAQAPLWYAPGDNGHVDCCGEVDGHFHVIDYKYGKGITVRAERNKQLAIYARSIIESKYPSSKKSIKSITLHIYQPRSRKEGDDGAASKWTCSWDALDLFTTREIEIPASLILKKLGGEDVGQLLQFAPSEKACQFCPAARASICGARADWMLNGNKVTKQLLEGFNPTYEDASTLTPAQIANLYTQASKVISFFEDIKKSAVARAIEGEKLPGLKLVEGNGSRSWIDDKQAALALSSYGLGTEEVFETKVISPAKAEEALSGTPGVDLEKLVQRKPGAPMLAPLTSKRKDWTNPAAMLQDETFGGIL